MSAFTATHLAVSVSSSVEMCFVTAAPHTCQVAGGARRSDGGRCEAVFEAGRGAFLEGRGAGPGAQSAAQASAAGSSVTLGPSCTPLSLSVPASQ